MKNLLVVVSVMLTMGLAGEAYAICGSPGDQRLNQTQAATALNGKRVNAVSPSGEDWKEDHCTSGALYKVGAGTAVDPRKQVGTWAIVGTGSNTTVQYSYTGLSPYTWSLWQTGSTVYFCNGASEIAHIVSNPAGPC